MNKTNHDEPSKEENENSLNNEAEQERSETDEVMEADEAAASEGAESIEDTDQSELNAEIASLKDALLREKAEFSNYRKRTASEKVQISKYAAGSLLEKLLPSLDSIEQLLSAKEAAVNSGNLDQFFEGAVLIQKQILQTFQDEGLELLDPTGDEFDPNLMEAIGMQESPDVQVETVQKVYQKGYRIDQKLIRPARVFVHKPTAQAVEKDESPEATGAEN